ncbi:hypothetical protein IMZ48_05905 [Candidatus Bathyarchaeota archaeon]|nr:hypothetical protein [Candidatus Bathyarchaeota archaeon]
MRSLAVECMRCGIVMSAPNDCPSCDRGMVEMPGADLKVGKDLKKG